MGALRLTQEIKNMKATELQSITAAEANSALSSLRAEQEAALAIPARVGDQINSLMGPRTIRLPSPLASSWTKSKKAPGSSNLSRKTLGRAANIESPSFTKLSAS